MFRISLAFLSIALLLATPTRAQMRGGGGGGAMAASMSQMGGRCISGSNSTGTFSSPTNAVTGGSTNATRPVPNPSAAYYGAVGVPNASMAGVGNSTSSAAALYGMGGYGVTAWSNPYAQSTNAFQNSPVGFGAMNGMSDGSSSFGWYPSNLSDDPFAAALVAAEWGSSDTMPRTRSKATKSRSKVKRRATKAKPASR